MRSIIKDKLEDRGLSDETLHSRTLKRIKEHKEILFVRRIKVNSRGKIVVGALKPLSSL